MAIIFKPRRRWLTAGHVRDKNYIEALLFYEELADQVWEAWDADETDDQTAFLAWILIAMLA